MKRVEYLSYFLEHWNYPEGAREVFLDAYRKLESSSAYATFERKLQAYEKTPDLDLKGLLSDQEQLSVESGVQRYTLDFLLLALMTEHLVVLLREKGISEEIIDKTIMDLYYKNEECWCIYGIWGNFVASWCIEMYDCSRVGLGRLQFELIPFGRHYEKDGIVLDKDDKVINIHIPRDGSRLSKESIDDALLRAKEFYKPYFQNRPMAFYCFSWLIYPDNLSILPENSNLRVFASYFDILGKETYRNWRDCAWRLFDTLEANASKLPEDTSLRRAYKKHLMEGGAMGEGIGIRIVE
ncbi:MAG: hypothetical protein KBS81_07315 [Spirochaetales bacterium]|nr:hypothetical protein [Candidatus Physcosoma equi]